MSVAKGPRRGRKHDDPPVLDDRQRQAKAAYNARHRATIASLDLFLHRKRPSKRPKCPICGEPTYSRGGSHPQCRVNAAESEVLDETGR